VLQHRAGERFSVLGIHSRSYLHSVSG
jgi:hypothetical protein